MEKPILQRESRDREAILREKVAGLPQNPGVYFFRDAKGGIIYIGKATNLRSRVSSYFKGARTSRPIETMIHRVADLEVQETDSVLEALILESNLIKKYQPKYNVDLKDGKSFSCFAVTKEEFPRVLIVRKTDLSEDGKELKAKKPVKLTKLKASYGPYTSKNQMETALKIIRKIFPFHSLSRKSEKGCLDFQLGLCPGPHSGAISKDDYKKNIRGIRMILEGKKKRLVTGLEKEMESFAKRQEFEKAAELRNKIFALNHIRDIALMARDFEGESPVTSHRSSITRIEAYDISNISGQHAVGSMVVFKDVKPDKSQYRKFKIRTVEGSDDVGMMREVLSRRFKNDWPMPDLVLLDGGQGHVNMAQKLLQAELGLAVAIAGVAKGPTRKKLDVRLAGGRYLSEEARKFLQDEYSLKSIMDEAHRFAIAYHRKIRRKKALE